MSTTAQVMMFMAVWTNNRGSLGMEVKMAEKEALATGNRRTLSSINYLYICDQTYPSSTSKNHRSNARDSTSPSPERASATPATTLPRP